MNCSDTRASKQPSDEIAGKPAGIIFTDFDGTLFNSEHYVTDENFEALRSARNAGYITTIATGRSLFSFRRVAASLSRPIEEYLDYLIFSSGAGVIHSGPSIRGFDVAVTKDELIEAEGLQPASAFDAAGLLFRRGIDFMIQRSVPENHGFVYIKSNGAVNPDFYRRIRIYSEYAESLDCGNEDSELEQIEKACYEGVSQLVAIVPPAGNANEDTYKNELIDYLRHRLKDCSVLRTTSPIDHRSMWIEVFSPNVSKSKSAERLTQSLKLTATDALAIGNDFNDEDLLHWAGTGRTVDEAPDEMKKNHKSAGRSVDSAVAAAIKDFID
ncbi:MAG: HAD family hydrolase [Spirochaetales bacterium]|uniref:HAD family hydrolase n=1 Tax=Candidatus Thalassospirochaeta sargassi TaxID=3119039 RepID=A0AAJ1MK74_9SPIO|nr:HAD family hydrolase [Spirochaetales bacterium]